MYSFFPTCQVRVVKLYLRCAAPPPSSFFLLLLPSSSPDLICQLLIAVVPAGSHLPALDGTGPRRTLTGESLSAVGLAGPQPATGESLSAVGLAGPPLPERCRPRQTSIAGPQPRDSEHCGPRRASAGEILRAVGRAGLQPDPNGQKQSHIECQRACQIECQIECEKICQIEC